VAALPTPDPRPDARGQASDERLRLLRELGTQAVPTWAALESRVDADARLVVVERAERDAFEDGEIADWIRDARRLSALDHPNVARVRDVIIRSRDILVVSEFVDGVRWRELGATAALETALRVFVDALTGLSALHNLRDAGDPKRQLFKLVHGGLTPDCIIVGLDGIARVVGASRPRSATARLAGTGSAYLAPEVLLEDDSADARADVYSIGVMLWEAMSQRRFLPNLQPSAIVTQLLSGRVPPVSVPPSTPWAAPLADVVIRALSADPEKRFPSAAAMAAELRRIGALKLPLAVRIAAGVRTAFGEAVKARRAELERGDILASESGMRGSRPASEELSIDVSDAEMIPEASQTASTVPPPMLLETTPAESDGLRSVTADEGAPAVPTLIVVPPVAPVTALQVAAPPLPAPMVAPQAVAPVRVPTPAPTAIAPAMAPVPPPVAIEPAMALMPVVSPQAPAVAPLVATTNVSTAPRAPVVAPLVATTNVSAAPPRTAVPPGTATPTSAAAAPLAITTAAPLALATPVKIERPERPAARPKATLRIAATAAAVLTIGAGTWWFASRDAHPTAVPGAPSAVAQPAPARPAESATDRPKPIGAQVLEADPANAPHPTPMPTPTAAIAPAPESAAMATPTPTPAPTPTTALSPAPAGARPLSPAGAPPSRPKHSPTHHSYDPQGI
jgi:hypothetical protein